MITKSDKVLCLILFVILLPLLFNCAAGKTYAGLPPLAQLRADIHETFEDPNFFMANWGVYIESLKTGEIIYKRNPYKLFMPASNMKLFTTSAALVLLGPEYRYKTTLSGRGEVNADGVLQGDLIITGSGDPSFSGRFFENNPVKIFEDWADSIKLAGISHINGNIIGDGTVFDNEHFGGGWEYDDLKSYYAAPVSGLSFNENSIRLLVKPGAYLNKTPDISIIPETKYVNIINNAVTIPPTRIQRISSDRKIGTNIITIDGTISIDRNTVSHNLSIDNPPLFTAFLFKEILEANGITCSGNAGTFDADNANSYYNDMKIFATYTSPSLSELLQIVNKNSNNFYADQILKTLGKEFKEEGSFSSGAEVVRDFISGIGINPDQFKAYDGSGLSRHNLVTPEHIAILLKYMKKHKYYNYLFESLPIAGVDGTIENRMKDSPAENIVHAKTGTIRYVRALSGYVRSKDNEDFIVSLLVNHYTTPSSTSAALQDRLFILLANFTRGK
jgi:D-alanyl-D-alanine carboxypeptidase/D-alanyl-D-alanine-endopeptidase (penicillin-binding protein 4)